MFRKMQQGDRALYHALATEFYNTDAILTEPDEARAMAQAVSMAGLARSGSARSTGTRIVLNTVPSC